MNRKSTPQLRMEVARETFLERNWPTSGDLPLSWGASEEDRAELTSKLRREKRLFGVWSPRQGAYIYPTFQFLRENPALQQALLPAVPALLATLESIPGFSDSEMDVAGGDPGRWRRLFWLYQPRSELSERSLAETALQKSGMSALESVVATDGVNESPRAPADVFSEVPDAVIELACRDAAEDRKGDF